MELRACRGGALVGTQCARSSLLCPAGRVVGLRQPTEQYAHIAVGAGVVDRYGVAGVPMLHLPRIEDDLLPRVIGIQGGDRAAERIVEGGRADAQVDSVTELVGVVEERFEPANRSALVVENRPAADYPPWIRPGAVLRRSGCREGFGLDIASEPVA